VIRFYDSLRLKKVRNESRTRAHFFTHFETTRNRALKYSTQNSFRWVMMNSTAGLSVHNGESYRKAVMGLTQQGHTVRNDGK
jgi:hypothetical protein